MSDNSEGSSAEEGSLCIDTTQQNKNEWVKRKGKGSRGGKGGKAGGRGKSRLPLPKPEDFPKPGDVVWAKVMGFNFWPAKVLDATNDEIVPEWLKQPPKSSYLLVRFFGTYDMQWVSPNSVETYARGFRKRFQSKSKSKVFQKAVSEVTAFMNDSVVPEGLTLRPPDPLSDSGTEEDNGQGKKENGHRKKLDLSSTATTTATSLTDGTQDSPDTNNSAQLRGSVRRKSSTPQCLSSSSSESQPKRARLESEEENRRSTRVLTPEVEAFTCGPLPSLASSGTEQGKVCDV